MKDFKEIVEEQKQARMLADTIADIDVSYDSALKLGHGFDDLEKSSNEFPSLIKSDVWFGR